MYATGGYFLKKNKILDTNDPQPVEGLDVLIVINNTIMKASSDFSIVIEWWKCAIVIALDLCSKFVCYAAMMNRWIIPDDQQVIKARS